MSVIEHIGTVVAQDGDRLSVQIEQQSACSSCQVRSACSVSEKEEKIIEVSARGEAYAVGEQVLLLGQSSLGLKAVFWAYVLPLAVMFVTLVVLTACDVQEALAGTLALCALVPYYLILRLFNKKMQKKFTLTVTKLNN